MPRKPKIPAYSLHKPSGRAVVKVNQRSIYLGKYGSDESRDAYARIVADLLAGRAITPPAASNQGNPTLVPSVTIQQLVERYSVHAQAYYRKDGRPTSEVASIRCAMKYLLNCYSDLPADAFSVGDLRAVRDGMVEAGLSRGVCNQNTGRMVRMFRWAASVEIVPAAVWASLQSLPGLKAGRTEAKESEPVLPVDDSIVDATLPHMHPTYRAMVELQRYTGMRPGEVCLVRPCDVDRSGEVWVYVPGSHKTEHHGKKRIILIGPKGQDILRPFLLRPDTEYCFRAETHTFKPRATRRYSRDTYAGGIKRACVRAGVAPWAPNQLRHTFATETRANYGLEAAQVLLGHSSADITQVYAERDVAKGIEVARQIG